MQGFELTVLDAYFLNFRSNTLSQSYYNFCCADPFIVSSQLHTMKCHSSLVWTWAMHLSFPVPGLGTYICVIQKWRGVNTLQGISQSLNEGAD